MIVSITDAAMSDLEGISNYIAEDNPRRAATFVSELIDRCKELGEMPRAFALIPRYQESGVRRRPFGRYLIFYRVGETQIDILHILNGAQDYEAILFPNE